MKKIKSERRFIGKENTPLEVEALTRFTKGLNSVNFFAYDQTRSLFILNFNVAIQAV